jgi:pyruvate dehydrogenase E2 component (dihydrolipoamide acetyltransferase)
MPKWGLSMQEGTIAHWWKDDGAQVTEGEDLVDIETPKITNVLESPGTGTLRRVVARGGETLPIGSLLGVIAPADVTDAEIESFIEEYRTNFIPEDAAAEGGGLVLSAIDAGGRILQIGRAGSGTRAPAVLIHGYAGDMNNWLFNIPALAADRPVIALDLPGHGGSSKDVGDGSLASLAKDVAVALDALGVARCHIVGHSLGGAVAARLAIDRPALVASLILICPSSLPGNDVSAEFLEGIVEARRPRDLKPVLDLLFADSGLVTKQMTEDMAKFKRLDGVDEALVRMKDQLLSSEDASALARDLAKIPSATIIASRADRVVGGPDETAIPASFRIHWIDGVGHMPHLEKPDIVNGILSELLRAE